MLVVCLSITLLLVVPVLLGWILAKFFRYDLRNRIKYPNLIDYWLEYTVIGYSGLVVFFIMMLILYGLASLASGIWTLI